MDTPRLTIRLTKDLNRRLQDASRAHHLSAAEYARRVLDHGLNGHDRRMTAIEQSLQRVAAYCEELVHRPSETKSSTSQFAKLAAVLERVMVQQTEALTILRVVTFKDRPDDYQIALNKTQELLRGGVERPGTHNSIPSAGSKST